MDVQSSVEKELRRGRTKAAWCAFAVWLIGASLCALAGVSPGIATVAFGIVAAIVFFALLHGSFNVENVVHEVGTNELLAAAPSAPQQDSERINHLAGQRAQPSEPFAAVTTDARKKLDISHEEWTTVVENSGINPERLVLALSGMVRLTRDEEFLLRLAQAYVHRCRGDKITDHLHPGAAVHLSWAEYKKWKTSGMTWDDFYRREIVPQGTRIGDTLWPKNGGVFLKVAAIEDGTPFAFTQYDPDDEGLLNDEGSPDSERQVPEPACGLKRTFTWISLWNGSEWIDCEPPWEHEDAPPQSVLRKLASEYKSKIRPS